MFAETQEIKDSKYEKIDIEEVAPKLNYLNQEQKAQLTETLRKFPDLFSGRLGHCKRKKFSLKLKDPQVEPYHGRAFSIPFVHIT